MRRRRRDSGRSRAGARVVAAPLTWFCTPRRRRSAVLREGVGSPAPDGVAASELDAGKAAPVAGSEVHE